MTTEFIHTDEINDEVLARAGAIIRRGGLVVFPTETVRSEEHSLNSSH